jgi:hypothetical protein
MGYALDWVSVSGLTKDQVLSRLGLLDTGEAIDYLSRGGFMWAMTPDGRVIVATEQYGWLTPERLSELSEGASLVAARAEDNDCTSAAWSYRGGQRVWSVTHDNPEEYGMIGGLELDGDVPAELATIRARLEAEQSASDDDRVDYIFDVPNELVATLGGWAPESAIGEDLQFFQAINPRVAGDRALRGGKTKIWVGLLILLLAVGAYRIWTG